MLLDTLPSASSGHAGSGLSQSKADAPEHTHATAACAEGASVPSVPHLILQAIHSTLPAVRDPPVPSCLQAAKAICPSSMYMSKVCSHSCRGQHV